MGKNVAAYAAATIFVVVVTYFSYEILRLRAAAKKKTGDIGWTLQQLSRGIDLIYSDDDDKILLGLEILYAVNHPSRLKALSRLTELASHPDLRISRQARKIIAVLSSSSRGSSQAKKASSDKTIRVA